MKDSLYYKYMKHTLPEFDLIPVHFTIDIYKFGVSLGITDGSNYYIPNVAKGIHRLPRISDPNFKELIHGSIRRDLFKAMLFNIDRYPRFKLALREE